MEHQNPVSSMAYRVFVFSGPSNGPSSGSVSRLANDAARRLTPVSHSSLSSRIRLCPVRDEGGRNEQAVVSRRFLRDRPKPTQDWPSRLVRCWTALSDFALTTNDKFCASDS